MEEDEETKNSESKTLKERCIIRKKIKTKREQNKFNRLNIRRIDKKINM